MTYNFMILTCISIVVLKYLLQAKKHIEIFHGIRFILLYLHEKQPTAEVGKKKLKYSDYIFF
jgi:hypothetical protein